MLYYDGAKAKKIAENVFLGRILIKSSEDKIVSQFHIRPTNDEVSRLAEVIFTEGFFNVSPLDEDRIVLGIWAATRIAYHICLVFAEENDAQHFSVNISKYMKKNIKIQRSSAIALFNLYIPGED